jgi:DNA-binding YbaB/EbfC family protein
MPPQPNMQQLMKQAQKMQRDLQAAQDSISQVTVEGTAGGGLVKATMTGLGDLVSIEIAPSVVDADDIETLQDLVVAAVHDAKRVSDDLAAKTMGPLAGGMGGSLGIPGL